MVDKAMELRYIGGVYGGNIKPTPFICLVQKFLQIQPEKDIVIEFIRNEEFKYVRALGAFYLRLTATAVDCYKYLEPLYNDYRKIRRQNRMGQFEIVHMDEFIDELLREERACDVILPRIQKRPVLEENGELDPKVSILDEDLDEEMPSEEEAEIKKKEEKIEKPKKNIEHQQRRERSPSREKYNKKSSGRQEYERQGGDRRRNDDERDRRYRDDRRGGGGGGERDRRRSPERSRYEDKYDDRSYRRDRSYERDRRRY